MRTRVARLVVVAACLAVFVAMGSALAVEAPEDTSGLDRQIAEGRVVYEANCQACHGADGSGTTGVFPPLLDNPAMDDTSYLVEVVTMGREGELVVGGVTYNGAMPAFGALSEDQVAVLVTYLQEGLGAVAPPPPPPAAPRPPAPGLPLATVLLYTAGFGVFGVVALGLAGPVAFRRRERHTFTTVEVWLKVAVIVVYFTVATVFVPSWVVESDFLAAPPSVYEDLFSADMWGLVRDAAGTIVWLAALVGGLWALRWAQRRDLI